MTSKTITRTLVIPAVIHLTNRNGLSFKADMEKVSEAVLSEGFESMFTTVMLNTYNGGGKDASDTDKLAALTKRIDGLYAGQWAGKGGGGASLVPYMWEAVMAESGVDVTNRTAVAAFEKRAVADIRATLGDKDKATFANYLAAIAANVGKARKLSAEQVAALRDKLADKYTELAVERRRVEAAVAAEVSVGADLDAMLDGIEL